MGTGAGLGTGFGARTGIGVDVTGAGLGAGGEFADDVGFGTGIGAGFVAFFFESNQGNVFLLTGSVLGASATFEAPGTDFLFTGSGLDSGFGAVEAAFPDVGAGGCGVAPFLVPGESCLISWLATPGDVTTMTLKKRSLHQAPK